LRPYKIEDSLPLLEQKPLINTNQMLAEGLSPGFQIAYQKVESSAIKFAFDIEKLDAREYFPYSDENINCFCLF
jgi:hypothetical protein